jgi:uncharacterized membrane protein
MMSLGVIKIIWIFLGNSLQLHMTMFGIIFIVLSWKKKGYACVSLQNFWRQNNWRLEANFCFVINFHLFFGNSHLIHTKVNSWVVCIIEFLRRNVISVGNFTPFGD